MNQRREVRFQANQSVAITLFGEPDVGGPDVGGPDVKLTARVKNVSGCGIGLEFDGPVAAGTALKIELEDALLLGEVIYCRKDGLSFYVGVELEHALSGLAELSRMVSGFAELRPQQAEAVVARCDQSQQQSH